VSDAALDQAEQVLGMTVDRNNTQFPMLGPDSRPNSRKAAFLTHARR
jgi:hypothetical protein